MRQSAHDDLQHPRRNLGNRYRTQAQKFVRLAKADPERKESNMHWAEQNARQALLHDFTDERNWRCLADIKMVLKDNDGLGIVLEDVFTVLGRETEQFEKLKQLNYHQTLTSQELNLHLKELMNVKLKLIMKKLMKFVWKVL